MNITFIDTPRPVMMSYCIGVNGLDTDAIAESKTITVHATMETKTRVHTALQHGDYRMACNLDIDGYKTDAKESYSFLDYNKQTSHYFKKNKTQDLNTYKEYLKAVIAQFLDAHSISLDELNVRFINETTLA